MNSNTLSFGNYDQYGDFQSNQFMYSNQHELEIMTSLQKFEIYARVVASKSKPINTDVHVISKSLIATIKDQSNEILTNSKRSMLNEFITRIMTIHQRTLCIISGTFKTRTQLHCFMLINLIYVIEVRNYGYNLYNYNCIFYRN